MRLFTAILFSDEIKNSIYEAQQKMRLCFKKGAFTQCDNLHLTLIFLGEIMPERLDRVKEAVNAVNTEPFLLRIGGIGCFRRESGGNIYWAGVERTAQLSGLYEALYRELKARGFQVDNRPYRPHLTLVRQAVPKTGQDCEGLDVPAMQMPVQKISLMKSERRDGRLVYTEIGNHYLIKGETV